MTSILLLMWSSHAKVIAAVAATVVLLGCKQKETALPGEVFIVASGGQIGRPEGAEVLLVERKQVLDFLESKRSAIESETASARRELETAETAMERARSDYNLFLTNHSFLTNADYIRAKAGLDGASQKFETVKEAADKWYRRNDELQAAASRAVQQLQAASERESQSARQAQSAGARTDAVRQTRANTAQARASSASSAFRELEHAAKGIFLSESSKSLSPGGFNLRRTAPPAGETRELAEWRAFLESAPEALKVIADKAAQDYRERESLKEKLKSVERAVIAETGGEVQSAEYRLAGAKSRLQGSPTAETYLASFQPVAAQKTRTDADGVFSLIYPHNKEFVIFAKAERSVRHGAGEKYYWLVNAPSGTGNLGLQLSNDNLAGTDSDGHLQVLNTTSSQSPPKTFIVKQGNIVVRVVGGRVAPVCWMDAAGRPQFTGPCLTLAVSVSNLSTTKKVDFETWRGMAALTDDNDNRYKQISVTPASNLLDTDPDSVSIHPQKNYFDRVVFEVPIRNFKSLHLKLPARNFGGSGMLRFEIPASRIEWSAPAAQ